MNELLAATLLVAAVASPLLLVRVSTRLSRPVVATVGTLAVAYGGRAFLRAVGGGYYCCSHAYYAFVGSALVLAGWVALVPALGIGAPVGPLSEGADDAKRSP